MTENSDIPGYTYDPIKKQYFKIEKHELPGFCTKNSINTKNADKLIEKSVDLLSRLKSVKRRRQNITELLRTREILPYSYDILNNYARHLKFKQRFCRFENAATHLLSPTCQLLTLTPSYLNISQVCWRSLQSKKHLYEFRISDIEYNLPSELNGLHVFQFGWRIPGAQLVLLANSQFKTHLFTLIDVGLTYQLASTCHFPTKMPTSRFATSFMCYDRQSVDDLHLTEFEAHHHHPVLVQTANTIFVNVHSQFEKLKIFNTIGRKPMPTPKFVFTACSEASLWGAVDLQRPCLRSNVDNDAVIYVGGRRNHRSFLSLVQPGIGSSKGVELIRFGTGYNESTNGPEYEVTNLQCIGTSNGNRLGLLVSRRCGLLELWDDRFPRSPCVRYFGSDGAALHSVASHIPPKPAIEPIFKRTVACPLLVSGHVGLWNLWTGEMLNLCKLKRKSSASGLIRPPEVFYRATWNDCGGEASGGPALLVCDNGDNYWFYV